MSALMDGVQSMPSNMERMEWCRMDARPIWANIKMEQKHRRAMQAQLETLDGKWSERRHITSLVRQNAPGHSVKAAGKRLYFLNVGLKNKC